MGWPAKGLSSTGRNLSTTDIPLVRETGRLFEAVSEVLEVPALLVEGAATANPRLAAGAGEKLVTGLGGTVTFAFNLPLFFVTMETIDLAPYEPVVNEALAYLDTVTLTRTGTGDELLVFPRGTRVRAERKNLVWNIPGEGEVVQCATESLPFRWGCRLIRFPGAAQERSWGFVVPDARAWRKFRPENASLILHEFYHQHRQVRRDFKGWSLLFWTKYYGAYPIQGYRHHWAESPEKGGAFLVELALQGWRPSGAPSTPNSPTPAPANAASAAPPNTTH